MTYPRLANWRSPMLRLKSGVLAAVIFIFALCSAYSDPKPVPHFQAEQAAKQHCPNDEVVWVNTKAGVYHLKGERWYGATKQGAYECRRKQTLKVIASPE